MQNNSLIIHAYQVSPDGRAEIATENAAAIFQGQGWQWIHIDGHHDGAEAWLEQAGVGLDSVSIDAMLAEETRPRMLEFDDATMLILRGVNLNENSSPEDMVSIRLWIKDSLVISVRRRPLKAVADIRQRFETGKGPKTVGEFVVLLTSRLFERMEPVLAALDEELDTLEASVIESPDIKLRNHITALRKQTIIFRRYIAPQKDVIMRLGMIDFFWLATNEKRRLIEVQDRVVRYMEDLDAVRERAQIVKDELSNTFADRMNRNMYLLSIITTIFLPLGFLTGLLGINVGGMPGAASDVAFWLVVVICVLFGLGVAGILKLLRWF